MKNAKKILCILATGCIIIGAIMSGAGLAMGGTLNNGFRIRGDIFHMDSWRFDKEATQSKGVANLDVEEFQSLKMDISYGDVEIKYGNDYEVLIENVPEDEYTIHQENGVLTIEQKDKSIFNFGLDMFDYDYKFTIIVPHDMDKIEVDSAMGDIEIKEINAKEMDINQSMGDIDLQDIRVSHTLRVEQSMGGIDFRGVCEGSADFTNSMGDTDIEILADEAAYQYELSTSMGTLEMNGKTRGDGMNASYENGNGDNRITADNSMGDISLKFR